MSDILQWLYYILPVLMMYLLYRKYRHSPERSKLGTNETRTEPASIVAVVGSGGHTREMLRLMSALSGNYSPRHYVVAYTDSISENKVHSLEDNLRKKKNLKNEYLIHKIPRCREVNQSWLTSFVCTVYSVLYCIPLMFICRPEIVLCNGPGTCIPVCLIGWLLKFIGFVKTRIIYVESICRVERLSMTGKILYNIADNIIVQWPELQVKYPKCEYYGRLV